MLNSRYKGIHLKGSVFKVLTFHWMTDFDTFWLLSTRDQSLNPTLLIKYNIKCNQHITKTT